MEKRRKAQRQERRTRTSAACTFCRMRKLRCSLVLRDDGSHASCENCILHQKECRYVPLMPAARPSKSRIAELEEENRRFRERLSSTEGSNAPSPSNASSRGNDTVPLPPPNQSGQPIPSETILGDASGDEERSGPQATVSGIFTSANGRASYHGLTSTLYDDFPGEENRNDATVDRQFGDERLTAFASTQRQWELINYNSGKLDFDGHHSFLLTYRPVFMRDMACDGPYFSKLLLNAIYFGASKFSPRTEVRRDPQDVRTAGWRYRQRVKELLGDALNRSEITTIQALLVMTSSLFALGDERNAAWIYAGIAIRMIIDLGLHSDAPIHSGTKPLKIEDLEMRRRVFWGAFVVDKIQSLYQGRPVSLDKNLIGSVPMVFLDHYEELEQWTPFAYSVTSHHPGTPAYSVSTFTELCKLCVILNDILNKVYGEKSAKRGSDKLTQDLKSINSDLVIWDHGLPAHLRFDPSANNAVAPPPHALSLHALYNVLRILLHRPFVSDGHLHTASPDIAVNSFVICAAAAKTIVQLLQTYHRAYSIKRAPYLISYATYVAATIHVRIAAHRGPTSEAHASLRACISVFNENQENNWAVRRAKAVILNLLNRMKVPISGDPDLYGNIDLENEQAGSAVPTLSHEKTGYSVPNLQTTAIQPTIVIGEGHQNQIAPDLDIDAIIQSFVHEQQTSSPTATMEPEAHQISSATFPSYSNGPFHQPLMSDGMYINPHLYWSNQPPADYSTNDMLFGFNGSALDDFTKGPAQDDR
ncbi:uncharacterized protein LY89DRAFT_711936 [Mollisia scopiformis]|uniref:Zn(2)-C6 fungal-type domain-containing protein n=1 Tax=Mollisia scopiformis TaxID=149040 RepID=A0A132B7X7_MOLSC|nr:uncharacterized protein LY89DRAFT_711936 [Mollisia scopiformis]KUJ07787.1 hypothetical protein LY89DRAFT_711936 [Mollisia scopiformis]